MMQETESIRIEAQQTLEELYVEGLLPFKLSARIVESLGMGEYIVRFHDSRLASVDISLRRDQSVGVVFRAAILSRVARLQSYFQMARIA